MASFKEMLERERVTFHGKSVKPVDTAVLHAGKTEVKVLLVHAVADVKDIRSPRLLHEVRLIVYVDGKPSGSNIVRSWWKDKPKGK